MLKPEVDTSFENIIVRIWADQAVMSLAKPVHMKITHTMILVCEDNDFQKYGKNAENEFLNLKKNLP